MAKENKMLFIDNVLRVYRKDKAWLAVLLGVELKELNRILSDDKTTYKDLQNLLQRGGITLRFSIQGEPLLPANTSRMLFLKNNLQRHRESGDIVKKATRNSNAPACWWKEDDITIFDLTNLEKFFGFRLLATFTGLGDSEDIIKNQPMKNGLNWKLVCNKTNAKYDAMLKILQQTKKQQEEKSTQNSTDKKSLVSEKKTSYYIRLNKKQDKTLKRIAAENNVTIKKTIEDIFTAPEAFDGIQIRKRAYTDDDRNLSSRPIDLDTEILGKIQTQSEKHKTTIYEVQYTIIAKYLREHRKKATEKTKEHEIPSDEKINAVWRYLALYHYYNTMPRLADCMIASTIALHRSDREILLEWFVVNKAQQLWVEDKVLKEMETLLRKTLDYQHISITVSTSEPEEIKRNVPDNKENKTSENRHTEEDLTEHKAFSDKKETTGPDKEKENQPVMENKNKKSFKSWLDSLPHSETNPFFNEAKGSLERLSEGIYGSDTINALRPFRYEDDKKLIELSCKLKQAAKKGEISFPEPEEPDYLTRSIIFKNADICEKYNIMKDVIALLCSSINNKPMEMKESFTDNDGKKINVTKLYVVKGDKYTALMATIQKKGFLMRKTITKEIHPNTFTMEWWYQIAAKAQEHYNKCYKDHISSVNADMRKKGSDQFTAFVNILSDALKQLVLETASTDMLNDFACETSDGKKLISSLKVKNNTVYVQVTQNDTEIEQESQRLDLAQLWDLFSSLTLHIEQKLKKY